MLQNVNLDETRFAVTLSFYINPNQHVGSTREISNPFRTRVFPSQNSIDAVATARVPSP